MEITHFNIEGLLLLKPRVFGDDRGYFIESYNSKKFNELTGLDINFVQDNESSSTKGVLRGLHFQCPPHAQSKLVRVIKGEVLDVAVDLRKNSLTYGQHEALLLNDKNKHQFFIPKGFAHAFVVLSDTAIFSYKVDSYYAPQSDSGIIYNDALLSIDWRIPHKELLLSQKDSVLQTFEEYQRNPVF